MDIVELTRQAPYLAAIVIIVWAFLNAQAKRDEVFLKAQSDRDTLFLNAIRESNAVITSLANEVKGNTQEIIEHDTAVREKLEVITRQGKAARNRKVD